MDRFPVADDVGSAKLGEGEGSERLNEEEDEEIEGWDGEEEESSVEGEGGLVDALFGGEKGKVERTGGKRAWRGVFGGREVARKGSGETRGQREGRGAMVEEGDVKEGEAEERDVGEGKMRGNGGTWEMLGLEEPPAPGTVRSGQRPAVERGRKGEAEGLVGLDRRELKTAGPASARRMGEEGEGGKGLGKGERSEWEAWIESKVKVRQREGLESFLARYGRGGGEEIDEGGSGEEEGEEEEEEEGEEGEESEGALDALEGLRELVEGEGKGRAGGKGARKEEEAEEEEDVGVDNAFEGMLEVLEGEGGGQGVVEEEEEVGREEDVRLIEEGLYSLDPEAEMEGEGEVGYREAGQEDPGRIEALEVRTGRERPSREVFEETMRELEQEKKRGVKGGGEGGG